MEEEIYADTAHGKWAAKYSQKYGDHPRVTLWMPTAAPHARLQTNSHGCREPDTLPSGAPIAYLTIGGVEIGGYLEDLEMLLAASQDSLRWVREQYNTMLAIERESVSHG